MSAEDHVSHEHKYIVNIRINDFWSVEVPIEIIRRGWDKTPPKDANIPAPHTTELIWTLSACGFRQFVVADHTALVSITGSLIHDKKDSSYRIFALGIEDSSPVIGKIEVQEKNGKLLYNDKTLPFSHSANARNLPVNVKPLLVCPSPGGGTVDFPGARCCKLCFLVHEWLGLESLNCACCAGWCKGVLGVGTCPT
jgi:hypothetical protein